MACSASIITGLTVLLAQCVAAFGDAQIEQTPYDPHHLRRNDLPPPLILDPVHPSLLSGAEGRHAQVGTGDYIMQGLGGTMNLVDQQYGLRESESFYWGVEGNPIANLTAFADGKAVRVLSLERFDDVLENADCTPSSVKLTFTKEVQFDAVQAAWNWVNDADENYIVLITESAQCNIADGDETVRQPWHVKHATFDDTTNVVTLDAEPKTWAEAFPNWQLKIRSRGLVPGGNIATRDAIDRRLELKGAPQINLNHDFSGANMAISGETDNGIGGEATINCTLCKTYGYLDFDIDIIPWAIPPHLTGHAAVTADAVGTTFQVKTTVKGSAKLYNKTINLFDFPLPIGRIGIPKVLDLAPHLKFSISGNIQASAEMSLESGVVVNITDDSTYTVDVDTWEGRTYGWIPTITPSMEPDFDSSASLSASIGGLLQLVYSGEVIGIEASVGIELAAPTLTLKASAFSDENACEVPGADEGMKMEVDLGMSFNAVEELDVWGIKDLQAHQTIWSTTTTVWQTCETIGANEATTSSAFVGQPTLTGGVGVVPTGGPYSVQNGTTWNAPYPTGAYVRRALRP